MLTFQCIHHIRAIIRNNDWQFRFDLPKTRDGDNFFPDRLSSVWSVHRLKRRQECCQLSIFIDETNNRSKERSWSCRPDVALHRNNFLRTSQFLLPHFNMLIEIAREKMISDCGTRWKLVRRIQRRNKRAKKVAFHDWKRQWILGDEINQFFIASWSIQSEQIRISSSFRRTIARFPFEIVEFQGMISSKMSPKIAWIQKTEDSRQIFEPKRWRCILQLCISPESLHLQHSQSSIRRIDWVSTESNSSSSQSLDNWIQLKATDLNQLSITQPWPELAKKNGPTVLREEIPHQAMTLSEEHGISRWQWGFSFAK